MLNGQDMGATHRFDTMNRDRAAWILAAATTLFHLLTTAGYGIFRDELYYLACADHIVWGYVDQPPLVAVFAWAVRHLLGTSLLALRLWPALSAGILVMLSAAIARQWRHIHDRHLWPGAGVALVLFAPHVIWQVAHGWPTVEFIQRATAYKNVAHSPLDFMAAQIEMMNPVAALLLLVGFGVLFCIARSPPVPRLGLGIPCHIPLDGDAGSQTLLPVADLPGTVRGRSRDARALDVSPGRQLDPPALNRVDPPDRSDPRSFGQAAPAGRQVRVVRGGPGLRAGNGRAARAGSAAPVFRRHARAAGAGRGRGRSASYAAGRGAGPGLYYLPRTMARPAPSISLAWRSACRRRSRATTATGCGDPAIAPARLSS